MKRFFPISVFLCILVIMTQVIAQNSEKTNYETFLGDEMLSQLAGAWEAKGISRNQDGSWKTDTTTSTWIWYTILNGQAVQDDFYANAQYSNLEKASHIGTNIRIYNEEEQKWHMAWIDTKSKKLATFTAVNKDGAVLMEGINSQGRRVKNTFFNIRKNRFDWQQEWTFDDGKSWLVVSKLFCSRVD